MKLTILLGFFFTY